MTIVAQIDQHMREEEAAEQQRARDAETARLEQAKQQKDALQQQEWMGQALPTQEGMHD